LKVHKFSAEFTQITVKYTQFFGKIHKKKPCV
jgi:hypothetical protein